MDLPLSWLQSFVAVAEELHFGRAARRVHRSSSAVSRHVAGLEGATGRALLRRTSRQVHLTDDGRELYAEVAAAVGVLERALARRAGPDAVVRVGYVSAAAHDDIPALVTRAGAADPPLALQLRQLSSSDQVAGLLAGELDVAIQWALGAPALPAALVHVVLRHEALVVVLPDGHRLAGFPSADLAQLAGDTWVMGADASDHLLREGFVRACRGAGFDPDITAAADGVAAQVALVRGGRGVCVAPARLAPELEGVAAVPLADLRAALIAVRRAGDPAGAPAARAVALLQADPVGTAAGTPPPMRSA